MLQMASIQLMHRLVVDNRNAYFALPISGIASNLPEDFRYLFVAPAGIPFAMQPGPLDHHR
jgi:hypothetical protein